MSERLREWRLSRARAARAEKPAAPPDPTEQFAKEAHDLGAIGKTVEDAAAVSAGFWLSYLFVLFYIGIAAGAVTHKDLLLENPVKLPFLNVELPLVAFFVLAPILFIVSHAYTLVHFVMLGAKVGVYDAELRAQLGDAPETRESLRRQLPSNIFVQFLAGPGDIRKGGLGFILKAIAWFSLVIGPVLLLLLLQAQFLPYHLEWVTWVQRSAVLAEVILLWFLWPAVLNGRSKLMWRLERRGKGWPGVLALTGRYIAGLIACMIPVVLAFTAATFPGEWMDAHIGKWKSIPPNPLTAWLGAKDSQDKPLSTSFHDLLFNGEVDNVTRRRKSLFSNTLVLPAFDALEAAKIDDPKKLDTVKHTLTLRGRHLESAVFYSADLRKADLDGAQLQGTSLEGAELQSASLVNAQLQGALLSEAQLQGTRLYDAHLQGASLQGTDLQGALLFRAHLQGALLIYAQLQGALLHEAQLQGASLVYAELQGASLVNAQLQGALFVYAQLQGASLEGAQLQGASLARAYLWRASLDEPSIDAIDAPGLVWNQTFLLSIDLKPWTKETFLALKKKIEQDVPGSARDVALERVEILDPDKTFEDKDKVPGWHKKFEAAAFEPEKYKSVLARELKALACSGDEDAPYIVRGLVANGRIKDTGAQAPGLVEAILKPDCPVSAALSEAVKAALKTLAKEASGAH